MFKALFNEDGCPLSSSLLLRLFRVPSVVRSLLITIWLLSEMAAVLEGHGVSANYLSSEMKLKSFQA